MKILLVFISLFIFSLSAEEVQVVDEFAENTPAAEVVDEFAEDVPEFLEETPTQEAPSAEAVAVDDGVIAEDSVAEPLQEVVAEATPEVAAEVDEFAEGTPVSEETPVIEPDVATDEFAEVEDTNATDGFVEVAEGEDENLEEEFSSAEIVSQELVSLSKFEKTFVNHTAYIAYQNGIKALYEGNYKDAYAYAMDAKKIYYIEDAKAYMIPLPYMPSYIRESSYTPKRIYYKMLKHKPYELKRLIIKTKLLSPPITSVIVKRTSTYIDIIIRNYGDLPLDNFELLLNNESVAKYRKILPNEEKVYRYESAPQLHEIAFKEEYGFAPNSILMNEGY